MLTLLIVCCNIDARFIISPDVSSTFIIICETMTEEPGALSLPAYVL